MCRGTLRYATETLRLKERLEFLTNLLESSTMDGALVQGRSICSRDSLERSRRPVFHHLSKSLEV